MREHIQQLPNGRVLDAACGTGRHTVEIVKAGHDVVGVDATEAMLEQARKKLPDVEFLQSDLSKLPFEDGSFKSIVCGLAVGHVPDLGPVMKEFARVLEPGGTAAISARTPSSQGYCAGAPPCSTPRAMAGKFPNTPISVRHISRRSPAREWWLELATSPR